MADKKYRVEGDTLIINDGVTAIEGKDFHIYEEDENEGWSDYSSLKQEFENIKKVIVPDSVTYIGEDTFCDFLSLEDISLPNSIKNIEPYVFWNCTSLKSITLPDSVTNIDISAFEGCTNLKTVTIKSGVTSIGDCAFYGCTSLKSVSIPNSTTDISKTAFEGCKNLTIDCNKGSYAEIYAKQNNIPIEYIDEHTKEQALSQIKDTILENGAGTLTLDDFGDKHYNVQIESDSEIYTFKVSLPVSKTVGGVRVQGFKELGYIDTSKDEVGKTLKEIAENTAVVTSRKNGSKSLNEIFKDNKGKTLD